MYCIFVGPFLIFLDVEHTVIVFFTYTPVMLIYIYSYYVILHEKMLLYSNIRTVLI